ncbi:MAG: hypothetical protein WA051_01410, partial [Minisyncoccia bacterium]
MMQQSLAAGVPQDSSSSRNPTRKREAALNYGGKMVERLWQHRGYEDAPMYLGTSRFVAELSGTTMVGGKRVPNGRVYDRMTNRRIPFSEIVGYD